jgi:hypothetical protein
MAEPIVQHFPNLDPARFAVTSPQTSRYNCIAHAAGDDQRWWWPDAYGIYYWPPRAQRAEHLSAFQQAFGIIGYILAEDGELEPGYEKIAVFEANSKPTHAAKQMQDGLWSSKLGRLEDITHHLEGIECDAYGRVAFFMKRRL